MIRISNNHISLSVISAYQPFIRPFIHCRQLTVDHYLLIINHRSLHVFPQLNPILSPLPPASLVADADDRAATASVLREKNGMG